MKDNVFIWFKQKMHLPSNSKIVFFRNPKEFSHFYIEKINPNHKQVIWGKIKKRYSGSKNTNYIMVGKITIPIFVFFTIDANLLLSLICRFAPSIIISYICVNTMLLLSMDRGFIKCLSVLRGNSAGVRQLCSLGISEKID